MGIDWWLLLNVQRVVFQLHLGREMREGMRQPGQRLLTATEKEWRVEYMHTLFSKLTKEVFSVHRAWRLSNMLPTMVHGQAFCIITWQSSIKWTTLIHHLGTRYQLWAWALGTFTSTHQVGTDSLLIKFKWVFKNDQFIISIKALLPSKYEFSF